MKKLNLMGFMKFKVVTAVILALVTLVILAAPVLASTARGNLTGATDPGTGTVSLRTSHYNYPNLTVSLKGSNPNLLYTVFVHSVDYNVDYIFGTFTTDARGNGRFTTVYNAQFPSGEMTFVVKLVNSYNRYVSDELTVTFK